MVAQSPYFIYYTVCHIIPYAVIIILCVYRSLRDHILYGMHSTTYVYMYIILRNVIVSEWLCTLYTIAVYISIYYADGEFVHIAQCRELLTNGSNH